MKTCKNCPTQIPNTWTRCRPCGDKVELARVAAANAAKSAKRVCQCGCGKKPPKYKKYAVGCAAPVRKAKQKVGNKRKVEESKKIPAEVAANIKPWQPPPVLMTSEENDRMCRKAEKELARRRGTLNIQMLIARKLQGAYAITAEQIGGLT